MILSGDTYPLYPCARDDILGARQKGDDEHDQVQSHIADSPSLDIWRCAGCLMLFEPKDNEETLEQTCWKLEQTA